MRTLADELAVESQLVMMRMIERELATICLWAVTTKTLQTVEDLDHVQLLFLHTNPTEKMIISLFTMMRLLLDAVAMISQCEIERNSFFKFIIHLYL
jgi:hypothetical protein